MYVSRITQPDLEVTENCPSANTNGVSFPNEHQLRLLLSRETNGRLNPSLRDSSLVQWGDAVSTLAAAAVFRLLEVGGATAPSGFGGAGEPVVTHALADLAVSGEGNLAAFREAAAEGGRVDIGALRRRVRGAVVAEATRLGATLVVGREGDIPGAVDHVVDRALAVVWALHGPASHRESARPPLGWIAVCAERDVPPRPVNVPATSWPCADLGVTVEHDGRSISTRIRYAIAGAADAEESVAVREGLPDTERPPLIPEDALVLVFLHGHSSRIEEAGSFYQGLLDEQEFSSFARPLVVIAFDFPSNGYSSYVDHEEISPLGTTTRFVPDRPEERRFGLLEYYEKVSVAFMEQLDRRIVESGGASILPRVAAFVGGSMGGNLALRLSERLVTSPSWLDALVSWSPASSYVSFGRSDYFIPSPGEHFDPIAKEALERPHERCLQAESEGSRADFIGLQMQGERLINDGTPGFEAGVRLLSFFLQPLVGGIAPLVLGPGLGPLVSGFLGPTVFGSLVVEGVANISAVKQSDEWLREDCRRGFDATAATQSALMYLNEVYSAARRRTHWRVAYEQLLFSHQDQVAASRGVPCYEASEVPTLLVAGANDVVDEHRFNIFGGVTFLAPRMTNNPGYAVLVDATGHSIHAERPRWLARRILTFLGERRPRRDVVAVTRASGRITQFHFGPLYKPVAYEQVLREVSGGASYFVTDGRGGRTQILARRFLTTTPDDIQGNNLRALPATSQPEPEGLVEGPREGFRVTHVRIERTTTASGRPFSWISHLCNDMLGVQASVSHAERFVQEGSARYYIVHDGVGRELVLREYLTTAPDDSLENNLSSLPEA